MLPEKESNPQKYQLKMQSNQKYLLQQKLLG